MALETPSFSESSSESSSMPFAPQFIEEAGAQTREMVGSAKSAKDAQLARLQDYIKHLYALRGLATQAAKSAGARGAAGQQNPLAVHRALSQMAAQAGIPIDAEISKVLQGSNNIENTLNGLLTQASQIFTQLGSIAKQQSSQRSMSQGGTGGGGSGVRVGGGRGAMGEGAQGQRIGIRGDVIASGTKGRGATQMIGDPGFTTSAPSSSFVSRGPSGGGNTFWADYESGVNELVPITRRSQMAGVDFGDRQDFNVDALSQTLDKYMQQLPGLNSGQFELAGGRMGSFQEAQDFYEGGPSFGDTGFIQPSYGVGNVGRAQDPYGILGSSWDMEPASLDRWTDMTVPSFGDDSGWNQSDVTSDYSNFWV